MCNSIAEALNRARAIYPEASKHHPVGTVWGRRSTDVLEPEPDRVRQNRPLPSKKSPDETQLSSRICSRKNKSAKHPGDVPMEPLRLSGGKVHTTRT